MTVSDLVFDFKGKNEARFRNDISVHMIAAGAPPNLDFEMATDEGEYMGGDETAPPPLAHFVTALAGCLMTQLRECAKRLEIELGAISVDGRVTWHAEMHGRLPYLAAPGGVQLDIELDTPVDVAEQQRLLDAATNACFVEATILNGDNISHTLIADGERIVID